MEEERAVRGGAASRKPWLIKWGKLDRDTPGEARISYDLYTLYNEPRIPWSVPTSNYQLSPGIKSCTRSFSPLTPRRKCKPRQATNPVRNCRARKCGVNG